MYLDRVKISIKAEISRIFLSWSAYAVKSRPVCASTGQTHFKESLSMKQNDNYANSINFADWFEVNGDIDDFIFYCEAASQPSEK